MPDPKYTDRQLDDMRKDFRDAERSPTETYMPVKQKAGQVADMLDDLADRRAKETQQALRVDRETIGACCYLEHPNGRVERIDPFQVWK